MYLIHVILPEKNEEGYVRKSEDTEQIKLRPISDTAHHDYWTLKFKYKNTACAYAMFVSQVYLAKGIIHKVFIKEIKKND